jgi:hypothetical protein
VMAGRAQQRESLPPAEGQIDCTGGRSEHLRTIPSYILQNGKIADGFSAWSNTRLAGSD